MSAIAATSLNQVGILAALPASPQIAPAFNGLLSALFGSPSALPDDATPTAVSQSAVLQSGDAPSKEIAGALIRSMFRGATFPTPQPVSTTINTLNAATPNSAVPQPQAEPSREVAAELIQSMFRGATFPKPQPVSTTIGSRNAAVANSATQIAVPQPQAETSKEIGGAWIQSMFRGAAFPTPQAASTTMAIPDSAVDNGAPQVAARDSVVSQPAVSQAASPNIAAALVRSMVQDPVLATQTTTNTLPPRFSSAAPKIAMNHRSIPVAPAGDPSSILQAIATVLSPAPVASPEIPPAQPATTTQQPGSGQAPAVQNAALPNNALIDNAPQIAWVNPPLPSSGPVATTPAIRLDQKAPAKQTVTSRSETSHASSIVVPPTPIPNFAPVALPPAVNLASPVVPALHRDQTQLRSSNSQTTPAPSDSISAPQPDATRPTPIPQAQPAQSQSQPVPQSDVSFAAILTPISVDPASSKSATPSDPSITINNPAPQPQAAAKPADIVPAPLTGDAGTGSAPRREVAKAPATVAAPSAQQVPQDFAPAFARAAETVSMPRATDRPVEAPPAVAAEALRASEIQPAASAPPVSLKGSMQEISFRLSQPSAPPVDLHVTERGGEIRVSVRTPDATLETSLRQNLPALANSLERAGYHAETFVPQISSQRASLRQNGDSSHPDWSGRGNSGGSQNGGRQQPREQRQKSWLEALENAQ